VTFDASMIGEIWAGVVTHLWQTTLVLGVLAALAWTMRAAPARVTNALWWIGLAKLLIPFALVRPLIQGSLGAFARGTGIAGLDATTVTVVIGKISPLLDPAGPAARLWQAGVAPSGTMAATLSLLWIAGAAGVAFHWVRTRPAAAWSRGVTLDGTSEWIRRRLESALEGIRVPTPAVRVTPGHAMPFVAGLVRPRILVSDTVVARLSCDELRGVLLHEDAHRRRLEPLRVALQRAAIVAFFYFPPLWMLLRALRDTGEMACDEVALDQGTDRSTYARALARVLTVALAPAHAQAGLAFGRPSLIRRRFDLLRSEGRKNVMPRHRICLALALMFVVLAAALPLDSPATADETAETPVAETSGDTAPTSEDPATVEERTYTLEFVSAEDPVYPDDAKRDGVGGRIVLELEITPEGSVMHVSVMEDVEDYPSLGEAAATAAGKWIFKVNGEPQENFEVIVPVEFKLHDEKTKEIAITVPDVPEPAPGAERPAKQVDPPEPPADEASDVGKPAEPAPLDEPAPPAEPEPPAEPAETGEH